MKKIWALLLTLTLVVGVVSPITTVYAEENDVLMMPYDETEKLNDVKIIPLSQSSQIILASTGLDTSKSNDGLI